MYYAFAAAVQQVTSFSSVVATLYIAVTLMSYPLEIDTTHVSLLHFSKIADAWHKYVRFASIRKCL
jgi:hypothetical protein